MTHNEEDRVTDEADSLTEDVIEQQILRELEIVRGAPRRARHHAQPPGQCAARRVLYRAMSPLERVRHRQQTGLLDPDEQAMIDELAAGETGD